MNAEVLKKGNRERVSKTHMETFGGDACVHYLDDDDGFTHVYIYENVPN